MVRFLSDSDENRLKSQASIYAENLSNTCRNALNHLENFLKKTLDSEYALFEEEGDFEPYNKKISKMELYVIPEKPQPITKEDYTFFLRVVDILLKLFLYVVLGIIFCIFLVFFLLISALVSSQLDGLIAIYIVTIFFAFVFLGPNIISCLNRKIIDKCFLNKIKRQRKIEWERKCALINKINENVQERNKKIVKQWEKEKTEFLRRQKASRYKYNKLIKLYEKRDAEGVIFYIKQVLNKLPSINLSFNDIFEDDIILDNQKVAVDIDYNQSNGLLILNYPLPDFEILKKLPKEVKYLSSNNTFKPIYYGEKKLKKIYNELIYQIIFSIINAIFSGDRKRFVEDIVVNGYVYTLDKSIGKSCNTCICSLHIHRKEFEEINLSMIDPPQCFKRLKGLAALQLENMTPIKPIMNLDRNDKRFIEAHNVVQYIDKGTNLAAIDWQDFENLIRELFQRKFSKNGGECKITQASRDGGVDAIAFDPDPIMGGKVIIQAKRYTNTVGVSAVRDLYGTLINEGASKGILITTSDFGSDAHNFAKGKPLILINGNNLLQLLEDEMHAQAYINISEAKKILAKKG